MAMTLNSEEQQRVNNVYNEREKALAENNSLTEGLINNATSIRDQQNAYLAKQEEYQNQQVDVNLERQKQLIDKNKEEAQKNRDVEERKAINSYMAFTNPYSARGTDNLKRGLANSGVSATERLGALTSYNDRVARANTALSNAIKEYDLSYQNAVQDGNLQKAQNALNKLQLELQNNSDYLTRVDTYKQTQFSNAQNIRNAYMDQYNTVYSQILKEQAQAEAARQWQAEYNLSKKKFDYEKQMNQFYLDNYNLNADGNGDTTEYYMKSAGTIGSNGKNALYMGLTNNAKKWFNNEFEQHSYKKQDLDYVITNAIADKKISEDDATKIYKMYGIEV